MPMIPIRGLGSKGIVTDIPSVDLGLDTFTSGNNVRFGSGATLRAPSWRTAHTGLSWTPMGTFDTSLVDATPLTFLVDTNGRAYTRSSSGVITDVSEAGFVSSTISTQYTSCDLGSVFYLNNEARVPRFFGPLSTQVAALPGWTSTHRAHILRSYKDFLVAFGVTKGAVVNPNLVKWSDVALSGAPPASWDETDPTKLAGENPLTEMSGPILEAQTLRDAMIIYGDQEVWAMEFVGGQFLFRFRKVFGDAGIMGRNCAVEVEGKHYVFGPSDIYAHDGASITSIAESRVRDHVYNSMQTKFSKRFFVHHNRETKEIYFCYVSGDSEIEQGFSGGNGCNRAAVFNYFTTTWSFLDLPNVVGPVGLAPSVASPTWASLAGTWDALGGTWGDLESSTKKSPLFSVQAVGSTIPTPRLSFLDPVESGSRVPLPLDPALQSEAFVEKLGIDLDAQGAPIATFKEIRALFPQIRVPSGQPVFIRFGTSATQGTAPTWGPDIPYNPTTDYKVDGQRSSGRYLAVRLTARTPFDFSFSGLDLDMVANGNR